MAWKLAGAFVAVLAAIAGTHIVVAVAAGRVPEALVVALVVGVPAFPAAMWRAACAGLRRAARIGAAVAIIYGGGAALLFALSDGTAPGVLTKPFLFLILAAGIPVLGGLVAAWP